MPLATARFGTVGPVLVLLHGLGATGSVWLPVIEALSESWPGQILVPDLRGHGRSPASSLYGIGLHAADVADLLGANDELYIAGHSMGGVVALALAGHWFGVRPIATLAFSMKIAFTDLELEKGLAYAEAEKRPFSTRDEAIQRYLKTAGLSGFVAPESGIASDGVVEAADGWKLSADPRTVLVAGPAIDPLMRTARGRVIIATGSNDAVAPAAPLQEQGLNVRIIEGSGHNPHVERPGAVAELIRELTIRDD